MPEMCICNEFWKYISTTTSEIMERNIPQDPKVSTLGDLNRLKTNESVKHFVLFASTAGKKMDFSKLKI